MVASLLNYHRSVLVSYHRSVQPGGRLDGLSRVDRQLQQLHHVLTIEQKQRLFESQGRMVRLGGGGCHRSGMLRTAPMPPIGGTVAARGYCKSERVSSRV